MRCRTGTFSALLVHALAAPASTPTKVARRFDSASPGLPILPQGGEDREWHERLRQSPMPLAIYRSGDATLPLLPLWEKVAERSEAG
jgi:hypothetical protein